MDRPHPNPIVNVWFEEAVLHLAELWKLYPCLYDRKCVTYNNKIARRTALFRIHKEMVEIIPELTTGELRTKMNYLRNNYGKELIKIKKAAEKDDVYRPTVYWFEHLSFLSEFCKTYVTRTRAYRSKKSAERNFEPMNVEFDTASSTTSCFTERNASSNLPLTWSSSLKNQRHTEIIETEDGTFLQIARDLADQIKSTSSESSSLAQSRVVCDWIRNGLENMNSPQIRSKCISDLQKVLIRHQDKDQE